jgi:hypothetical protein
MPKYTFAIMGRGEIKSPETVLELPKNRALWSSVEALALRAAGRQGAFIQVKNLHGTPSSVPAFRQRWRLSRAAMPNAL